MTRFEMFKHLFEPESGWTDYESALRAFRVWEARTRKPEDVIRAARTWESKTRKTLRTVSLLQATTRKETDR